MAARVTVRKEAVRDLLRSPALQADLLARAQRIAAAAGPGMEASVRAGRKRARASVITDTQEARENEATHRALTKALDAGRG